MKNILFVCTGNQYRSPLAAAYFQKKLQQDGAAGEWLVSSAGTWVFPGHPIPKEVKMLAAKLEMSLVGDASCQVSEDLLMRQNAVLVMETGHEEALKVEFPKFSERIFLLSRVVDQVVYNIPDPRRDSHLLSTVAKELFDMIDRGYPKILRLADTEIG